MCNQLFFYAQLTGKKTCWVKAKQLAVSGGLEPQSPESPTLHVPHLSPVYVLPQTFAVAVW